MATRECDLQVKVQETKYRDRLEEEGEENKTSEELMRTLVLSLGILGLPRGPRKNFFLWGGGSPHQ